MAYIIRRLNLVLSYKGNRYRRYKWVLALLKLKGLIKIIKIKGQKDKGGRYKVRLFVKRGQLG